MKRKEIIDGTWVYIAGMESYKGIPTEASKFNFYKKATVYKGLLYGGTQNPLIGIESYGQLNWKRPKEIYATLQEAIDAAKSLESTIKAKDLNPIRTGDFRPIEDEKYPKYKKLEKIQERRGYCWWLDQEAHSDAE